MTIKIPYTKTTLFLLTVILFIPSMAFSQAPCGNIVEIADTLRLEEPIVDCDNPFKLEETNPDIEVNYGDTTLLEEGEYPFLNETNIFAIEGSDAFFVDVALFFHDGEDYLKVFDGSFSGSYTFDVEGTYTFVVYEESEPMPVKRHDDWLEKIRNIFVPEVFAQVLPPFNPPSKVITFDVVAPEVEPDIDPLILQYEPVLYLHPDENYEPMNVEAFIEASALWDDNGVLPDALIKQFSESDPVTTEDVAVSNSENWYLSFSDPENSKSFDPAAAKNKYDELVANGKATTTYYAYKMEDSYIDDEGEEHEFIVLQYWYFYAFNDWLEQGGRNNHEGDWESVFVFLEKDSLEPKYVAYSSHLNDGNPELLNFSQYNSVRRAWNSDEVRKDGGQIVSFVSLGSHANYPNNGDDGNHPVTLGDEDKTSTEGNKINVGVWKSKIEIFQSNPEWIEFEGKWGTDGLVIGTDGPQGPKFIDVTGEERFNEPIEWAGIDNIQEKIVKSPTDELAFPGQYLKLKFASVLDTGVTMLVDMHQETITYGINIGSVPFLPRFWDITSNLENGAFEANVTFEYDEGELDVWDLEEENLSAYIFNEETEEWEVVPSVVDTASNTVSFLTTHFSRYAIGEMEPLNIDELYEQLRAEVDELQLHKFQKRLLKRILNVSERLSKKEKLRSARYILSVFEWKVEFYVRRGKISEDDIQNIKNNVELLDSLLKP